MPSAVSTFEPNAPFTGLLVALCVARVVSDQVSRMLAKRRRTSDSGGHSNGPRPIDTSHAVDVLTQLAQVYRDGSRTDLAVLVAGRAVLNQGVSGSIREYQGVSGIKVRYWGIRVPDIRELGPTGYPGYLRDIETSGIRIRDGGIRISP